MEKQTETDRKERERNRETNQNGFIPIFISIWIVHRFIYSYRATIMRCEMNGKFMITHLSERRQIKQMRNYYQRMRHKCFNIINLMWSKKKRLFVPCVLSTIKLHQERNKEEAIKGYCHELTMMITIIDTRLKRFHA